MSQRPLILDSTTETPLQNLQPGQELDIPLDQRFERLKTMYGLLILWMIDQKFDLPSGQIEYLKEIQL